MVVGAEMIFIVKTNTKLFFKETIDNLTKNFSVGSYLMLGRNPMVPGGRPLMATSYKYNGQKVISFIATYYSVSTK